MSPASAITAVFGTDGYSTDEEILLSRYLVIRIAERASVTACN